MTSTGQVQPTLLDYLAALRRRKFVIIGTTVLVAVVALALSVQQTKIYRASAQVLLSRQDLSAALTQTPDPILNSDPARVAATQAGIARLPDVASRATFFGVPGTVGVTDVALGNVPLEKAVVRIAVGNTSPSNGSGPSHSSKSTYGSLVVLPAGELPGNPGEFVGTAALERLIAELRDHFDIVLIDAPPMGVVGDAMTLSARVDALVVVARLDVVDKKTLEDLARELNASPTPKLGFVLTGADRNDSYGAGYYGYRGGRPEVAERTRRRRATSAL